MTRKKTITALLGAVIACSVFSNILLAGVVVANYRNLGTLVKAALLVKYKALPEVTYGQLIDGASAGIVGSLKDPYSTYLGAEDFERLRNETEGIFGGVGLVLDISDQSKLKVVKVLSGSPADKAGLRKGDIITAVNGQSVDQITAQGAADLLKGEVGTALTLTVIKDNEARDFRLTRQFISLKSVESKLVRLPEQILYLKINSFSENTEGELVAVLENAPQVKGIVLDLRDNAGGGLEEAVRVTSYFVPKGPVVHLVYRDGHRETYEAAGDRLKLPLVVAVNKGTASAAEIVAAAIQDTKSGVVVGEKTYGKGVVQTIYDLKGGGLKLTTARYLTPLGKNIDKKGIDPDYLLAESESGDAILVKALKLLKERI